MDSEHAEQVALRQYCDLKQLPYFAVPSETYTTSWNQKRINRAKGVVKGIPDFWVVVKDKLLAIEMKKKKGGRVSPEQEYWIEKLLLVGVRAKVCKGADEAIAYIESFLIDTYKV